MTEKKENVLMALTVKFTSGTCVPVPFVCRQVDRWPVKSEFMAK